MDDGGIRVRPARRADAELIAGMANALNEYVGKPGRPFSTAVVREHGFGPDPAFSVLLGEMDRQVLGYALFHPAYDSDLAVRALWLLDLFVVARARGRGVGRALMSAVARPRAPAPAR